MDTVNTRRDAGEVFCGVFDHHDAAHGTQGQVFIFHTCARSQWFSIEGMVSTNTGIDLGHLDVNLSSKSAPERNRAKPSNGTAEPSFFHWPMAGVTKAKLSSRSSGHRHREELVAPLGATTVLVSAVRKQDFRGSRLC